MKTLGIVAVTHKAASMSYDYIAEQGIKQYSKHPEILIHSQSMHYYSGALKALNEGNRTPLTDLLQRSLEVLKNNGVQIVCIPNNSAHRVLSDLQVPDSMQLISIIDPVIETCELRQYQSVCLMGPSAVVKSRMFADPLSKRNISCIVPEEEEQAIVQEIIAKAGTTATIDSDSIEKIQRIVNRLKRENAFQAVIVACSELTSILPESFLEMPVLNPFQLLVQKALDEAVP